jgi:maltoporin
MIKNVKSKKMLVNRSLDKKPLFRLLPMVGLLLATTSISAMAVEVDGLEILGYTRGGFFTGTPRGGYSLGGDTQKFRLGNEGDNGFELEIRKNFDLGNGIKWSMDYMPTVWNGDFSGDQAYAEMTGLEIAPSARFWAGQRRLRIQDVHIVDYFLMDYGVNFGAGMTGLDLGFAKLGVGAFNGGSLANKNSKENNARRYNVDLSDIKTNPGGVLRFLGTVVTGDFAQGSDGGMLSVSHNQSDFIVKGLTNTLFLQTATGHAALNGQFLGLGDTVNAPVAGNQPGKKSNRIADTINWQTGPFGGQALVAFQNGKDEGGANDGKNTKDFTLGGRISYAFTKTFKLLVEAGYTTREPDGAAKQQLTKFTIAPTLAVGPDFWSRPELRLYVTQVSWNDAAGVAANGFGEPGRKSSTIAGAQIEAWW